MLVVAVVIALAADTNKITRFTRGMIVIGGTSSTTGNSVVVSESVTNEYRNTIVTATVAGVATASTNTFATAFTATPSVFLGQVSGLNGTQITNSWSIGTIQTSTTLIVTGLSTNGSTGVNNLPIFVYGTTRSGVLQ